MDPEIKAKWIAALRSGKYPQTTAFLRTDKGFCCLGVLCDVARPSGWSGPTSEQPDRKHMGAFSRLAHEFAEEVELSDIQQYRLANMNDTGKSFAEIADYIEQNL